MKTKIASLLLAAVLAVPGFADARETLIMTCYGGAYQNFFETEIIPEFTKNHDCEIKLAIGLAKDWLAEMRASGKDKAPYDVVMMNEIWANQMRLEGYFDPFDETKLPHLKDALITFKDKNDKTCGVIGVIQPAGIAYLTDKVSNPPKSWKDLWKPEYKNKLGLYTATNAMGGQFLLTVGDVWFNDQKQTSKAIDKINELKPFKLSEFSGDMEKQLTLGEVEIGVLDTPAIARLMKAGVKIGWSEPAEHMLMFEQVFSVHTGSEHKALAHEWIDYLLTPEVQAKFVRRFYTTPCTRGVEVPEDLKPYIPVGPDGVSRIKAFDWAFFNATKSRIIREWNQKIAR